MIGCPMFYHAYLDLFINCNYLAFVWLWLYACLSYDPCLRLIKLFLYHINFVTFSSHWRLKKRPWSFGANFDSENL
jgi:hypothetical protein